MLIMGARGGVGRNSCFETDSRGLTHNFIFSIFRNLFASFAVKVPMLASIHIVQLYQIAHRLIRLLLCEQRSTSALNALALFIVFKLDRWVMAFFCHVLDCARPSPGTRCNLRRVGHWLIWYAYATCAPKLMITFSLVVDCVFQEVWIKLRQTFNCLFFMALATYDGFCLLWGTLSLLPQIVIIEWCCHIYTHHSIFSPVFVKFTHAPCCNV